MIEIEAGDQLVQRQKARTKPDCFCGHDYDANHSERWPWKRGVPLWRFETWSKGRAICTDCKLCRADARKGAV